MPEPKRPFRRATISDSQGTGTGPAGLAGGAGAASLGAPAAGAASGAGAPVAELGSGVFVGSSAMSWELGYSGYDDFNIANQESHITIHQSPTPTLMRPSSISRCTQPPECRGKSSFPRSRTGPGA